MKYRTPKIERPKNEKKDEWSYDLPPDYTAEELRSYLPGKNLGAKFIEWYRQDIQGRGLTVPFMKYSGPGNPTNIGEPVNEADKFAKIHDLEYAYAKFRHNKGYITEEQLKKETDMADTKFMKSNGWNITSSLDPREQLASIIGGLGIGVKYGAESIAGQMYPSLEKSNEPDIPTTSANLANKLMKNLQTNISLNRTSDESGSMSASTSKAKKSDEGNRVETGSSGGEASLPHKAVSANIDPAVIPQDIEMGLTGTGKEQASGGASSDGQMVHVIPKPMSMFGDRTNVYTKTHKFMTFGFADELVDVGAEGVGNTWLTSYLAEVPWHIPAFYLNQSEFNLLSNSAHVQEISIEIAYRGSTIQFETAATATGLATLNQINDISVAHALNRTGWGSNVSYTAFSATQPMLPTGVDRPKYGPVPGNYRGMVRDYYGSENSDINFLDDIPKHQTGRQCFLYNYWAMSTRGGNLVQTGNRMFGGWPALAEKIKQMDGKTVVNQVVASSTYNPKFAPIKPPLRSVGHGLPFPTQNGTISVPGLGEMVNQRQANVQISNVPPTTTGIQQQSIEASYVMSNAGTNEPIFDIFTPIEKCQIGRSGMWGLNDAHIQPSVHIGVQPVPALSSAALLAENLVFNNWTDTRAYWEITATMKTKEMSPTHWPYATVANVPVGEQVAWAPAANRPLAITDARNDGATFGGLYTLSVPLF
nr:MAG: capsid protein [Skomarfal virus 23]